MEHTENIIRSFDELGRILVPKEIRRKLDWNNTDKLSIHFCPEDKSLTLKPVEEQ